MLVLSPFIVLIFTFILRVKFYFHSRPRSRRFHIYTSLHTNALRDNGAIRRQQMTAPTALCGYYGMMGKFESLTRGGTLSPRQILRMDQVPPLVKLSKLTHHTNRISTGPELWLNQRLNAKPHSWAVRALNNLRCLPISTVAYTTHVTRARYRDFF